MSSSHAIALALLAATVARVAMPAGGLRDECTSAAGALAGGYRSERAILLDKLKPHLEAQGLVLTEGEADPAGNSRIFFAKDKDGNVFVIKTPLPAFDYASDGAANVRSQPQYVAQLDREVALNKRCGPHPNRLPFPEKTFGDPQFPFLVLPYGGRSLEMIFAKECRTLPSPGRITPLTKYERRAIATKQKEMIGYLRQICHGLQGIHEKGYVHGDIKPANIVVQDGVAKLIDYGLSTQIGMPYLTYPRTDPYGSPSQKAAGPPENRRGRIEDDIFGMQVMLNELNLPGYDNRRIGAADYERFKTVEEFERELARLETLLDAEARR